MKLEFPEASQVKTSDVKVGGEYGPATYKTLEWVGRILAGFLEVWKRDWVGNPEW